MSREKGLLFFGTAFRLVAIDPKEMRIAVKDGKAPPIPARKSVNYLDSGLPHCAGYAVHGSKVYMMGGHWMRKEALDDPTKIPNVESPVDGEAVINSNVYVADLTTKSMKFEFSPICKMNAPKNKPKVMEIKGKLYVLSNFNHKPESYDTPTFEVYDPKTNRAKALPEPPFFPPDFDVQFDDEDGYAVNKWFAVRGKKIYVMAENFYYSYKVETKRWRMSVTHAWTIESFRWGLLLPGYHDVLLKFHKKGASALLICDGREIWMQQDFELEEEAEKAMIEGNIYLKWDKGKFVEMGKLKVGAIVPGGDMDNNLVVLIFTFVVSKVDRPIHRPRPRVRLPYTEADASLYSYSFYPYFESKFLSVTCLNMGIYNLGPRPSSQEDAIVTAFFAKGL